MVHLVLSATRGNAGGRFFPHQGYLGLTPVRVEGIVRTKLDSDGRPIAAKSLSISIRCYQTRLTRTRQIRSTLVVDHSDVVWVKPPTQDFADVGELEFPFKLTLPKRNPGFSTANFQDYRVFWRLEAILEHAPIPAVGSRIVRYYDLAIIRYDAPQSTPPPPRYPLHSPLPHQTTKPRAPVLRYNIAVPTAPIGPSDLVRTTVSLQPVDTGVSIRSAAISIERRIELHTTPSAPAPLVTSGINHSIAATASPIATLSPTSPSSSSHSSDDTPTPTNTRFGDYLAGPQSPYDPNSSQATFASVASTSSTAPLLSPPHSAGTTSAIPIPRSSKPSASPTSSISASPSVALSEPPAKTLTSTIVTADASSFDFDPSGQAVKNVTLQWPQNRGHFRWAIGETMHSQFASVRFFLRVKVVVTGPGGSDALDLEPQEVTVVSTNASERRIAMEKWAEQKELAQRSKSKSPWRKRGEEDGETTGAAADAHGLPSPPQTPAQTSSSSSGHRMADGKPRKKMPRRPHTSAGPRDKSHFTFTHSAASESEPPELTSSTDSRSSASSSHDRPSGWRARESGLGESMLGAVEKVRRKARGTEGEGKRGRESGDGDDDRARKDRLKTTGLGLQLGLEVDEMRAWEAELARIEVQSRRSSIGMFGMFSVTRRRTGG
ncbi:uncharacterized protein BXZ73DRAFT_95777 [Epithele typhae]|uniref:uncharacterized protein n=1 Tax=Epithele typhae TaxID=378194 RepID=UPI002007EDD3|nr:uncharacterized protein BXZ73DRAFT_95777 [Epithele typhae]KAH9946274.1 hypothetical protein BXZ73DRAFT_95777 [Epithele typhae]